MYVGVLWKHGFALPPVERRESVLEIEVPAVGHGSMLKLADVKQVLSGSPLGTLNSNLYACVSHAWREWWGVGRAARLSHRWVALKVWMAWW